MNMATPIFSAFIDMIEMQGVKCDLEKGTGAYGKHFTTELEGNFRGQLSFLGIISSFTLFSRNTQCRSYAHICLIKCYSYHAINNFFELINRDYDLLCASLWRRDATLWGTSTFLTPAQNQYWKQSPHKRFILNVIISRNGSPVVYKLKAQLNCRSRSLNEDN